MRDASYYARRTRVALPAHLHAQIAPSTPSLVNPELPFLNPKITYDPAAATGGEPIPVVANHGRWVVNCPDCGDAQLGAPEDRRFLCVNCGNASNGGLYRPVAWPKDRAKIEALLDARPLRSTRNWLPGESVYALTSENKVLGVPGA